jgi:hypothetical protein
MGYVSCKAVLSFCWFCRNEGRCASIIPHDHPFEGKVDGICGLTGTSGHRGELMIWLGRS